MQIPQPFKVDGQIRSMMDHCPPCWNCCYGEASGRWKGQTGGQSATPRNGWNIDEHYGRVRKGGMTYSSGTVSLNLQRWQHPDRQVQSNTELCVAVSEWSEWAGNHGNNDTNNVHCQGNICRRSGSCTERSHWQHRFPGTSLTQRAVRVQRKQWRRSRTNSQLPLPDPVVFVNLLILKAY